MLSIAVQICVPCNTSLNSLMVTKTAMASRTSIVAGYRTARGSLDIPLLYKVSHEIQKTICFFFKITRLY